MFKIGVALLFLFFLEGSHKFHVSTSVIEYKKEEKTLQITSQIFIDDLELVLKKDDPSLRLAPDNRKELIDSLVNQYFEEKIKMQSNSKPLKLNYLGREYKNDIAVNYIEIDLQDTLEKIEIENKLLLEFFDDQKNIIHFKHKQTRKSFLLHKNNSYIRLDL